MPGFSHYVSHGSFFFSDLVRSARKGEFVLPAFQRGFVWDEADILKLLDSMWRGYPIGTVLLWENWCGKARSVRPFRGCSEPSRFAPLVLDGQQRIQALIEATAPGSGYAYELTSDQFVRVFEATLVFRGMARGRSAAYALFSDKKTGKDLTMFLVDLADLILSKEIDRGMITGKWTFCKRGQNYGVRLVEEEVKK